jgi:hypothetical protein
MAIHRGDPGTPDRGRPTFGIDLTEQMTRDNVEVPPIVEKCCEAIERLGLQSQGLYRLSGTQHKVLKLKEKLDRGECYACSDRRTSNPEGVAFQIWTRWT